MRRRAPASSKRRASSARRRSRIFARFQTAAARRLCAPVAILLRRFREVSGGVMIRGRELALVELAGYRSVLHKEFETKEEAEAARAQMLEAEPDQQKRDAFSECS